MTLNELASDLFLFLVTFRRQVRKGLIPDIYQVRSQLLEIFETQQQRASEDPKLEKQYQKGRYPLVVTADEILINANWAYSSQWEDEILEYEFFKTRIAGEKFFETIEELGDEDDSVAEILYHCLALGFVGRYKGDAEELRRLKRRLYRMLPGRVGEDDKRISPDAYFVAEGVKDIYKPLMNLTRIVLICGTLLIVLWIGFFYYRTFVIPSKIKEFAKEMRQAAAPGGYVLDDDDENEEEEDEDEDEADDFFALKDEQDEDEDEESSENDDDADDVSSDEDDDGEDEDEDEDKDELGDLFG